MFIKISDASENQWGPVAHGARTRTVDPSETKSWVRHRKRLISGLYAYAYDQYQRGQNIRVVLPRLLLASGGSLPPLAPRWRRPWPIALL